MSKKILPGKALATSQSTTDNTFKRPHSNELQKNFDPKKAKTDNKPLLTGYNEDDDDDDGDGDFGEEHGAGNMGSTIEARASIAAVPLKPETISAPIPGLPEGFFDDPEIDAKARNIVLSDALDAEFEKFKREMQVEELKQDALNEVDDDVRDIDRELEEVDELIYKWTKIENLHQRKEQLKAKNLNDEKTRIIKKKVVENVDEDDDEEIELDEVMSLQLRSKHRC